MMLKKKRGFTLMEILIAVLIIGILGAIAVPQYQRALLKSRYAALMPIAKSMANSNEAYYLEHGIYADDPQDLLIQGQSRYTDDTELEFGTVSDYAYVLAKNEDKIPNNTFVVYQKHSGEFSGEIHCEALANNDLAESVCKSFGGNESIGKTLTDGYETYVLFGTGNGVSPSGDNGGNDEPEEPEEPQTPTCEGAAPTKQEACSSGCGSVTVTAECEEGEWVYPTADMSSCPVKPNDETVACDTGFTGNKTRTATCNSAGTAWEFTDNWNTSGCTAVPTCSGSQPPNITASQSGATGTASCVNGEWVYTWTGGREFDDYEECYGACAGGIFKGGSTCLGTQNNSCIGSTFTGDWSNCYEEYPNACAGSIFKSGTFCVVGVSGKCNNVTYEQGSWCSEEAGGHCPAGSPKQGGGTW